MKIEKSRNKPLEMKTGTVFAEVHDIYLIFSSMIL